MDPVSQVSRRSNLGVLGCREDQLGLEAPLVQQDRPDRTQAPVNLVARGVR